MFHNSLSVGLIAILKYFLFTPSPLAPTDFTVSATQTCLDGEVTVTYTGDAATTATLAWNFSGATVVTDNGDPQRGPFLLKWPTTGAKNVLLTVTTGGTAESSVKSVEVTQNISTSLTESICQGEVYMLGNQKLMSSGMYTEVFSSSVPGCDSTVTLNLTVNEAFINPITASICQGESFLLGTDEIRESGTYEKTFRSGSGCDSTVILTLEVFDTFDAGIREEICEGESFLFDGRQLRISGTYLGNFQTVNECDSNVTLTLVVLPAQSTSIDTTICEGESFMLGEEVLTEPNVYTRSFLSQNGCDSIVTVDLEVAPVFNEVVNAALCEGESFLLGTESFDETGTYEKVFLTEQGCDSIITLNLTVHPSYSVDTSVTICEGETYMFGNEGFSRTGTYPKTFFTTESCDSIVTLNLTVLPNSAGLDSVTICSGEQFIFAGDTLTVEGNYEKTFPGENGCDSVHTIALSVLALDTLRLSDSFCEGDIYRFGNQSIDQAGDYTMTFQSLNGCDSTVVLSLAMQPTYEQDFTVNICEGEAYEFGDTTFTEEGFYTANLQTVAGCDSTVHLNLIVNPQKAKFISESVCGDESFFFIDENLTEPGIYRKTIQSNAGCDSTVILTLRMGDNVTENLNVSLCEGSTYTFGEELLTESGTYTQNLQTIEGCDSTVVLSLSIASEINVTLEETICEGESYTFDDQVISRAGTYLRTFTSVAGCDSVVTLSLSVALPRTIQLNESICFGEAFLFDGEVLLESGDYQATYKTVLGCDSMVNLSLTVLEPIFRNKTETICEGESYDFDGQFLTEEGIYQKNLMTESGCDSVVTLKLNVIPVKRNATEVSICPGSSYVFGDEVLTESGVYSKMFPVDATCDSMATVILDVDDTLQTSIDTTVCRENGFLFGGETIFQSGVYTRNLTSSAGCDSVVTLELEVRDQLENRFEVSICEGEVYDFGGNEISRPGIHGRIFPSSQGCDSVVTIILTVVPSVEVREQVTICEGGFILFGDRNIFESGTYVNTFTSSGGCDSTVTLDVNVMPQSITIEEQTICAGDTIVFGDQVLTESGTYLQSFSNGLNCDSIVSLELSVKERLFTIMEVSICNGETFQFGDSLLTQADVYTRSYPSINGCDSTVSLLLMVEGVEPARTVADFGVCENETELTANLPDGTSGIWSVSDTSVMFTNAESPETLAMGLPEGATKFTWSLSTENCPAYSTTDVEVNYGANTPIAEDDYFGLLADQTEYNDFVTGNDLVNRLRAEGWFTQLLTLPNAGTLSLFRDGSFNFFPDGAQDIDVLFSYELINGMCPEFRDTANVTLVLNSDTREYEEVIGITPNGDGVNDRFIIPELRVFQDRYEDNELFVFNRNGDEIFYARPYNNDWGGTNKNGNTLPAGTYYYVAYFRTPEGDIKKDGLVVIVR